MAPGRGREGVEVEAGVTYGGAIVTRSERLQLRGEKERAGR